MEEGKAEDFQDCGDREGEEGDGNQGDRKDKDEALKIKFIRQVLFCIN